MKAIKQAASRRVAARTAGTHGQLGARAKGGVNDYTKRQGNPEAGSRGPAFPGKEYGPGGKGFIGAISKKGSKGFIGKGVSPNGGPKASSGYGG